MPAGDDFQISVQPFPDHDGCGSQRFKFAAQLFSRHNARFRVRTSLKVGNILRKFDALNRQFPDRRLLGVRDGRNLLALILRLRDFLFDLFLLRRRLDFGNAFLQPFRNRSVTRFLRIVLHAERIADLAAGCLGQRLDPSRCRKLFPQPHRTAHPFEFAGFRRF